MPITPPSATPAPACDFTNEPLYITPAPAGEFPQNIIVTTADLSRDNYLKLGITVVQSSQDIMFIFPDKDRHIKGWIGNPMQN
jgi:hypothetical protein